MPQWLYKITQFMYGRYGTDKLNFTLSVFALVISLINSLFFRSLLISLSMTVIWCVVLFRFLSKNIPERQSENKRFLRFCQRISPYTQKGEKMFRKIKSWGKLQSMKLHDRKTHRYLKCPYCKAVIRVPLRKGHHTVRCPKCHEDIKTNIRF